APQAGPRGDAVGHRVRDDEAIVARAHRESKRIALVIGPGGGDADARPGQAVPICGRGGASACAGAGAGVWGRSPTRTRRTSRVRPGWAGAAPLPVSWVPPTPLLKSAAVEPVRAPPPKPE